MKNKLISIIIVTWNSEQVIKTCLDSLFKIKHNLFEIIVVDNNSQDQTIKIVTKFRRAKLLINKTNLGFSGGCNLGARKAKGEYLFFLNPDTTVKDNSLKEILHYINKYPDTIAIAPKILFANDKNVVNSAGNIIHYLGLSWAGHSGEPDHYNYSKSVTAFSGAAVVISKNVFDKMDGFDENFFAYCEDADLSWRMRLFGYQIIFLPTVIVYHNYHFTKGDYKYFLMFRNSLWLIYKNYSTFTLVVLSPMLIVVEMAICGYFLFILRKPQIFYQIFKSVIQQYPKFKKSRQKIQKSRVISDRSMLNLFASKITFSEYRSKFINLVNIILNFHYQLIKLIIPK